ncbi:MAG: class D sortase [Acutalibacteraceae bacterium]
MLYIALAPVLRPVTSLIGIMMVDDSIDLGSTDSVDLFAQKQTPDDPNQETVKASAITFPAVGDRFARITIEGVEGEAPVYFGDFDAQLQAGIGQYNGSLFPGCGGTALLSGHNNGYFHGLQHVDVGTRITLETNYGTFVYETVKTAVLNKDDKKAVDLAAKEENLVLYTCYPFDMLGLTPYRFFVYAKLVSGPRILLDQ